MVAGGGRCLLAVALAAAWISGAAAAVPSSAEQAAGSHKSIKCMPCSRTYIGDAYLDTLTAQLAQRRDLVEVSDSGELCKRLADDVEVPMLSKLRRQLVGEGSHRRLVYSVDFGACEGAVVNFLEGYDAHLVIFEKLPDGVFADPFELQHFVERKVFVDVAVFGDTNLELPTALSNRSSVEIHFDLRLAISTNCSLVIDMPLHARYPPLDAGGYAIVEFGNPELFLRYRKKEIHSDSCLWVIKNLKAAPLEKAAWRIPCGDEAHIGFVQVFFFTRMRDSKILSMHPHLLANDNLVTTNFASTRGVFANSIELELQNSNHIETRTRSGSSLWQKKELQKKNHLLLSSVHAPEAVRVKSCNGPSSCKKVVPLASLILRSVAVLSCFTVWTCKRKPDYIVLTACLQSTMLNDTES